MPPTSAVPSIQMSAGKEHLVDRRRHDPWEPDLHAVGDLRGEFWTAPEWGRTRRRSRRPRRSVRQPTRCASAIEQEHSKWWLCACCWVRLVFCVSTSFTASEFCITHPTAKRR